MMTEPQITQNARMANDEKTFCVLCGKISVLPGFNQSP
jgi:hypothetical protein